MARRWWLFRESLAHALPRRLHLAVCPHCRGLSRHVASIERNNRWAETWRDGS